MFFSFIFLACLITLLISLFKKCTDKQEQLIFISAFTLKIVAGIGVGLLYIFYYKGGDTFNYLHDLQLLNNNHNQGFIYTNNTRAWFFIQLLAPIFSLSFSNYWGLATILSTLAFISSWLLFKELSHININRWVGATTLFFIPSFVFWTSGVMKETVAVALIQLSILCLLQIRRDSKVIISSLLLLSLLTILFFLKYYLFAPLALASLLFYIIHYTQRLFSPLKLITILGLASIIGYTILSFLHPSLTPELWLEAILGNYELTIAATPPEKLIPISFDGSFTSLLQNIPIALYSGLFGPSITNTWNTLSVLLALENLVILSLFLLSLLLQLKHKKIQHPELILLGSSFILFLAIFLPIGAPNYGSIARYRTTYYFIFTLFILQSLYNSRLSLKNTIKKGPPK